MKRIEGARFHRSPPGAAALTAVIAGLSLWGVAASPLFGVRDVRVTGAVELSEQEVERLSGVKPGDNIIQLSVEAVVRSLRADPRVAVVEVSRSLPSTVTIEIVERHAAGWLKDPAGRVLVAGDGTVLDRPDAAPTGVPWVGRFESALAVGDRLPEPGPSVHVAASLPPQLLSGVASVRQLGGEILLELRSGERVAYGPPTELPAKNASLASMLDWADEQGIVPRSLDVRIPSTPTLLPSRG